MNKPFKSVEELAQYLMEYNSEESEDDADSLEDVDFVPNVLHDLDETDPEPLDDLPSCSHGVFRTPSQVKKNIIWKKKSLQLNDDQLHFHGNSEIEGELLNLETPYQFFSYFFFLKTW